RVRPVRPLAVEQAIRPAQKRPRVQGLHQAGGPHRGAGRPGGAGPAGVPAPIPRAPGAAESAENRGPGPVHPGRAVREGVAVRLPGAGQRRPRPPDAPGRGTARRVRAGGRERSPCVSVPPSPSLVLAEVPVDIKKVTALDPTKKAFSLLQEFKAFALKG